MAEITLDAVSKIYPDGTEAVHALDLDIGDGEFVVLVGPSGCGKTTALRMIAGLEEISEGTISIGGRVVNELPPRDRDIAMVFQNYALYPHMSVFDNMAFGLKLQKVPRADIQRRVREAAGILGLTEYLGRKPKALSGGQRQRVAMGRAIVRHPQAFLMDEPLSNLDAKLRVQMRAEIARIQADLEVTTVYVTHDQVEAMTMGDRVAVIRKGGVLQQVDNPQRLYERPTNVFVAGFIGSPAMNLLEATLVETEGGFAVKFAEWTLPIPDEVLAQRPALRSRAGSGVVLGIRPEDFEDVALMSDVRRDAVISVTADLREAHGSDVMIHFRIAAPPAVTEDVRDLAIDIGEDALHHIETRAAAGVTDAIARLNPRTRVQKGERVDLAVDVTRMHFFDPESGVAVYE